MTIKTLNDGICSINGIKASGFKEGKYGISIIYHENLTASAVYTSNKVYAAPVTITKKHLQNGKISAVLANSGNANCYTKKEGIIKGLELTQFVADKLEIPVEDVAVTSTGVIGRQLPLDILKPIAEKSIEQLEHSKKASTDAATAIMTTDTIPKECAVESTLNDGTVFKVAGICKGSGMIAPNMGTMNAFIITDLDLTKEELEIALRKAVNKSFNMIVVDGDESTNDTAILMSTNEIKGQIDEKFQEALDHVCISLAKIMAKDGEGASKYIEAVVEGASSLDDAILASKSIVSSSLVKSAVFGADPNWGRIIAAVGYSKASFDPDDVSISIEANDDKVTIVDHGDVKTYTNPDLLKQAEIIMKEKTIIIRVNLFNGSYSTRAYGCDLTYDYVKINAEYTT